MAFVLGALAALTVAALVERQRSDQRDEFFITPAQFEALVKSGDTFVIAFMADWCGHCKRARPWLAQAALTSRVPIHGMYESSDTAPVFRAYDITAYPTILKVSGPSVTEYDGPHSVHGFLDFARN